MKNLKKILGGALVAVAAFGFFGCDNTEEDEELVVTITESGDDTKTVTMTTDEAKYGNYTVHIAYTIDGSVPSVSFDRAKYAQIAAAVGTNNASEIESRYYEYFEYETATIYDADSKPTFDTTCEVKAIAFYVNTETGVATKGPVATKKIEITSTVTTTASADNAKGGTFKLSKTGNSNMIHYFDMSDATFDSGSYQNCYYQIQFSYKGFGKGNWYLYVRQAGSGQLLNPTLLGFTTTTTKYIASGTYTGNCFEDSKGAVDEGDLNLFKSSDTTNAWKTVHVDLTDTTSSFELKVDGDTTLSSDAK